MPKSQGASAATAFAVTSDTDQALARLVARLKATLRRGARNGRLPEALDKGLGLDANSEAHQQIIDAWGKRTRDQDSWAIPTVIVLPETSMGMAQGGYWSEGKVIYISAGLLKRSSPKRQLEVLSEELFHYYEDIASRQDSPGDEGEKAAKILLANGTSPISFATSAEEDDHMLITNEWGQSIVIEAASITGTTGNDNKTGSDTADVMIGLAGNDTLLGIGGNDSILGDAGDDRLEGGKDQDTIRGGAGKDTIFGNEGNDTLYADTASFFSLSIDSLIGGSGDDRYYIDSNDVVVETADVGSGIDMVVYHVNGSTTARTTFTAISNVETFVAVNTASTRPVTISSAGNAVQIFGGLGADSLVGSSKDDLLDQGGGGIDELVGGAGKDTYQFNLTTIKITEAPQTTSLVRGSSEWDTAFFFGAGGTYYLHPGIDEASLERSKTTTAGLVGNEWGNILWGDLGENQILGGAGNDSMFGGDGNQTDTIEGGTGRDGSAYTDLKQLSPTPTKISADIMSAMSYNNEDFFAFQNFFFEGQTLDKITGFVFSIAIVSGPLAESSAATWGAAIDAAKKGGFKTTEWGLVKTTPLSYIQEGNIPLNAGISLVYSKETRILKYYTNDDYTYGSSLNPGAAVANLSRLDPLVTAGSLDGTDFRFMTDFNAPLPVTRPIV